MICYTEFAKKIKICNKRSLWGGYKSLQTLVQLTDVQGEQTMNSVFCRECDHVGDRMFSKEGASQTHRLVLEIPRNTVIRPRSFHSHPFTQRKTIHLFGCYCILGQCSKTTKV